MIGPKAPGCTCIHPVTYGDTGHGPLCALTPRPRPRREVTVVIDVEALQAALAVIGAAVSLQDPLPRDHPLARAEYALDSALLEAEGWPVSRP